MQNPPNLLSGNVFAPSYIRNGGKCPAWEPHPLFFYPGDFLIKIQIEHFPEWTKFMEMSADSYGGFGSGVFSFFVWIFLLVMVVQLITGEL
jgi:hypothetical protein